MTKIMSFPLSKTQVMCVEEKCINSVEYQQISEEREGDESNNMVYAENGSN
jgi:hypothetical protein